MANVIKIKKKIKPGTKISIIQEGDGEKKVVLKVRGRKKVKVIQS